MTVEYTLDELRDQVSDFVTHRREDSADTEAAIRRAIRACRTDQSAIVALRLLLGELLCSMGAHDKARRQYRKVLEQDAGSIDAMIHIGDSFMGTRRFAHAKRWLSTAFTAAEAQGNHAGQLDALDSLAYTADLQGDPQAVSDAFSTMCRVLQSAPMIWRGYTLSAQELIFEGRGAVALPFLRCLIKHVLERGYPRVYQYQAFSAFTEALCQEGHSDEEIRRELCEFRHLAANDEIASDFDIAVGWSFGPGRSFYRCLSR